MPLVAAVVIGSLGVGIGVNTTVFSWIASRVLRPLPGVSEARSFYLIEPRAEAGSYPGTSWLEYRDFAERLRAFDGILAFRMQALTVGEASQAERASGLLVSGNYFSALGMQPVAGRFVQPEDASRPGGEPVVVISYDYWQNRFEGAATALGTGLLVNGRKLTIIGVTPHEFQGTVIGMNFDLWVPATMAPALLNESRELEERGVRGYQVAGKLRASATLAQAQTELDATMRDLANVFPETNQAVGGEILPFWQSPRGPQRMLVRALAILQAIMVVLLLAVCGNTATLLLARASMRQQEVGVRLAVGAGPARVVRLLLTENLILALAGVTLGVVLAMWGTTALRAVPLTSGFPVRIQTSVDTTALAFAVGLGCICALIFGAAPAWQLSRVDPLRALRSGARATSRSAARSVLIGTQVALALVVLIVAGLFFRNLREARDTNPGFTREGVLLGRYDLTGRSVAPSAAREFARRALDAMRALPNVSAAALAQQVPLDIHGLPLISFTLEGPARTDGALDRALSNVVTPGYFRTMGIPLLTGSDFVELGDTTTERQAIVNEEFVRRYMPLAEPLGRRIEVAGRNYVITATVRNSVSEAFGEAAIPCIYFSYRDRPAPVGQFHLRAGSGDERQLTSGLRRLVGELEPSLPVYDIRTLTEHVENNLGLRKIPARMFVVLGPLVLALAAIGIYAVAAYTMATRTSEIGVRLALGATARGVVQHMVRDNMKVVAIGCAAGWLVAYVGYARIVQGPIDVAVFAGVPVILLGVAAAAAWLPARRVVSIDPVLALKQNN